jgi:hypothetical protein
MRGFLGLRRDSELTIHVPNIVSSITTCSLLTRDCQRVCASGQNSSSGHGHAGPQTVVRARNESDYCRIISKCAGQHHAQPRE